MRLSDVPSKFFYYQPLNGGTALRRISYFTYDILAILRNSTSKALALLYALSCSKPDVTYCAHHLPVFFKKTIAFFQSVALRQDEN